MALPSALFSLLSRKIGDLVQAPCAWEPGPRRIWQHPRRVARFGKGTVAGDLARGVFVSAVSFGLSELVQRAMKKLLPPMPEPQPVPAPSPPVT